MALSETRFGKTVNHTLFWTLHLACFAAIFTGVGWKGLLMCAILYGVRMFAVTGVYHRYFSHRTYKMGRVTQFLMAVLAMTSAQKGVLWWAANHRHHHKHSDDHHDLHSPRQKGFWQSHVGWILTPEYEETDYELVKDLAKYKELVWLNKHPLLPTVTLGVLSWLLLGWEGLVVGYLWSTVLLWHGTFTINSLSHVFGNQRYDTGDDSRNNWLLALITFGEGWHNNHHYYAASVRQGFRWYEYDLTYYILWTMSKVGLVWDLRMPPQHVIDGVKHPRVLELEARRAEREPATEEPDEGLEVDVAAA